MTTYGTIPVAPPGSSNLEFISRANERIRTGLATRKPWSEMINLYSITLPTTVITDSTQRLRINLAYFRVNYAIVVLFTLFLTLLWHPISLIVFIITMSAWFIFYLARDEPLMILGLEVDDRLVLLGLSFVTIGLLFLTGVTFNIVVGLVVGAVVVVVHGVLRRTDDLILDGVDHEERLALKETASSSYSTLL